jgi:hypothetical protein
VSRHFNAQLSHAEYAAFKAARSLAQRDNWMHDAAQFKARGMADVVKLCVGAARDRNREYLKAVAEYRALKAPKRKRA